MGELVRSPGSGFGATTCACCHQPTLGITEIAQIAQHHHTLRTSHRIIVLAGTSPEQLAKHYFRSGSCFSCQQQSDVAAPGGDLRATR